MKIARLFFLSIILILTLASCRSIPSPTRNQTLSDYIDLVRDRAGLPSLAVSIIEDGQTVFRDAVGLRNANDGTEPVKVDDAYHIGSCTKSMTAVLAALLVQDGLIDWDSTVAEVLAGVVPSIHHVYTIVTLEELLSMSGGISDRSLPQADWIAYFTSTATPREQRIDLATRLLAEIPANAPGEDYEYSNYSVAIAGLMLETVAGVDYETLLTERLFAPLGMSSAGFGPPATRGTVDAPWGHNPRPVAPDTLGADNPPVLGPAGRVHASLVDLEQYARLFLARGFYPPEHPLLSPESIEAISRPRLESYGLGWMIYPYDATDPTNYALVHDGSNTMFYATLYFSPPDDFAVIVLTNRGDGRTPANVETLVRTIVERHLNGTLEELLGDAP